MILSALQQLYIRLAEEEKYDVPRYGFSPQKIAFKIVITPDGTLHAIEDARDHSGKKPVNTVMTVPGNAKPSGSGINPCLLWDNAAYMLGYKAEDKKPERTRKCFEAFRLRHLDLEAEIQNPAFSLVCRFLENWNPDTDIPSFLAECTGFGVFQILGKTSYVHEEPSILTWWVKNTDNVTVEVEGQCLVTGENGPVARLHPGIKSVAGAQSSGASLVSFNAAAYESYGLDQAYNAPVSTHAAFQYGAALNNILSGPQADKHRLRIGDTTTVFWTDKPSPVEDIIGAFFSKGSDLITDVQDESLLGDIKIFLQAVRKGGGYHDLDKEADRTRYYLLGLSPNAARLSVRFFHEGSVTELLANLHKHHADMSVIQEYGPNAKHPDPEFPSNWALLRQTARETKEIPPLLAGPLMRAVITGCKYPEGLYDAVIRRIRADRTINFYRACIIRGVLNRNHNQGLPMSLDIENTDAAYRLGRLFAALEKTQTDALGNELNATIRDKFYNTASATPGSVFPRVLRTYQHHLGKLKMGMRINREKLVQEILDPIPELPTQLNLRQQGQFALGYYHQRKDFFTKKDKPNPDQETTENSNSTN